LIGRMEQNNSKHRRQGVIDELFGRDYPESLDKLVEDKPYTGDGALLDTGKYQILDTLTAPTNTAKQKAADAINGYPEMKAMVGLFEYNPPACYQALKQAGKLGEIKLIGFDENPVTLQGIKDGHITGTIVQDPSNMATSRSGSSRNFSPRRRSSLSSTYRRARSPRKTSTLTGLISMPRKVVDGKRGLEDGMLHIVKRRIDSLRESTVLRPSLL